MDTDRNGLELSPMVHTDNAYKFTSVDWTRERFRAYVRGVQSASEVWSESGMINFSVYFKDPRDAAYTSQSFMKLFTPEEISDMFEKGTLKRTMKDYYNTLDIPEWEFEPEGLTLHDLESGNTNNYIVYDNSRDALRAALKVFEVSVPPMPVAKELMNQVETVRTLEGLNYFNAAKKVIIRYSQEKVKESA